MKFNEKMLLLYAVTDRAWVGNHLSLFLKSLKAKEHKAPVEAETTTKQAQTTQKAEPVTQAEQTTKQEASQKAQVVQS